MNHPARTTDPSTSHEAANRVVASGKQRAQQAATEAAVRRHPGQSSLHLATLTGLDRHMLARRLPELEREGRVWRGPKAPCASGEGSGCTWWPVPPGQNMLLGL
ncbi:winged helix-turn-helix domain-containing protein [Stenotrophomonas sp. G106K1]|uniref:winged helix-turn-helix domain-containing protein n=1 Tax=Stenotrophomonas sp. G106K1 TaxID=3134792 RepID=UPI0030F3E796